MMPETEYQLKEIPKIEICLLKKRKNWNKPENRLVTSRMDREKENPEFKRAAAQYRDYP
jgi:hypothetical protein